MDSPSHTEDTIVAKVIGPLHSAEARGRIAGLIFNTWRGISTVKAFCSPAQPRTAIQLLTRAWTTQLVRAWATITQANRNAWNAYSVTHPESDWTGNPKRLTGLNWFVRCNARIFRLAGSQIDNPPAVAAPDPVADFAAANGVEESVLTWTFGNGANNRFWVYTFGPHSTGLLCKIERASINLAGTAATATVTHSNLAPGRYTYWICVVDIDTGLRSTYLTDTADVTAA